MPVARFQMPDGRIARFEVPEGTTPEQAQEMIAQAMQPKQAAATQPAPSTAESIGMGMADPIHGGAQLLTKILPGGVVKAGNAANNWIADKTGLVARLPEGGVDEAVRQREAEYQARRGPDAGIDWARLGGSVASPVNLALGAAAPMARAATLAPRMAVGAAGGAAASAMAPVTDGEFWDEKGKQVATGAAFGGAVPAAAAGVGRVISPRASVNPNVAALRAEGVRPTVGQTLGGMANRVEEKAISLPVVGDAIRNARQRASDDLARAVAKRALDPVGQSPGKGLIGRELVADVQKKLSDGYEALLPRLTVKADSVFNAEMTALRQSVATGSIDPKIANAFARIVKSDVLGKLRGQQAFTGQTFKDIESDLGAQIARFGKSQDPDAVLLSDALREVQSSLRSLLVRNNPAQAARLKALNTGYANFMRLQRAASFIGAEGGEFNASQLQSAVKALDRSKNKGAFSQGKAYMQDLSDPAKMVLGDKVPNSGTADRMLNLPNLLAAGAVLSNPMMMAAPAAGWAAYTPPAQALLRGLVASRPAAAKPIANALNRTAPMLAPAGGLFGIEVLK